MRFSEREGMPADEFIGSAFPAIEEIVTKLGYECVNIALVTEDGRAVLRVMIDSIGGINVKDCETVSKAVNNWLDAASSAESSLGDRYYLEVSSPGVERPLFTQADYARFQGREARVKTSGLADGRKIHVGFITASDGEGVTLDTEQGPRTLLFADITRAALVFRGLEPQPPKSAQKPQKTPKTQKTKKRSSQTVIEAIEIEEEHLGCS